MKTKFSLNVTSVTVCIFLFTSIIGCDRCRNGGGGTTSGGTTAQGATAVSGACKAVKSYSEGLWNCDKGDCTGTCMMQVRHITPQTPADTVWRDVPGGNVNDDDLKANKQEIRCVCR